MLSNLLRLPVNFNVANCFSTGIFTLRKANAIIIDLNIYSDSIPLLSSFRLSWHSLNKRYLNQRSSAAIIIYDLRLIYYIWSMFFIHIID